MLMGLCHAISIYFRVRIAGRQGEFVKLRRRQFLNLASAAAAALFAPRVLHAEAWPARPVHLIVGFAPGGVADLMARLIGQQLSERFGQPFVVENRTGAGTNIATESVVRAAPDGYTLLLSSAANAINATLYRDLTFNFIRDTVPVAGIARTTLVMVVNPSYAAKTVPAFIDAAKASPGKITMASAGAGSPPHMAGELFKLMTATDLALVPYRGDVPAIIDLLAGQVQVYFATLPSAIEHIKAGKLLALAVTSASRSTALPDVPALAEFVPAFEATAWTGVSAPGNTPAGVVDSLNREINAALADPKIAARIAELGATPLPGSSADYARLVAMDTEKWSRVITQAGLTPQ
jgi:tripartite-type tricarboxylate transporter receptor subunit TctC